VAADARDPVADVAAWSVVAVGRLLAPARVRCEAYVGPPLAVDAAGHRAVAVNGAAASSR
jgi:hypothetical protein